MKNLEEMIKDLKSVGLQNADAQRLRSAIMTLQKLDLSAVVSNLEAGNIFYGSSSVSPEWTNAQRQAWTVLDSIRKVRQAGTLHKLTTDK